MELRNRLSGTSQLTGEAHIVQILRGDLDKLRCERDDTVHGLEAEVTELQHRLAGVEQNAKGQVERAMRDRQQLQLRVEELLERLEDQAQ